MIEKLRKLHAEIERRAQKLHQMHGSRLNCKRGCAACCVDGLTVFAVEAENIRQNHAGLLAREKPNEKGGCAFLDENKSCRIYQSRPYVCRTQGLPLRWLDEIDDEVYEFRDICPLNEEGEAVEELPEDECWTIGEFEEALAALEAEFDGGEMRRVSLRDLFSPVE